MHIAVEKRDPFLLELLLSKCPGSANAPMYNDNRPLHSAATLTEVTDAQQLEIVNILLKYGADKALRNKANKLPIELVQQDRDRVNAPHLAITSTWRVISPSLHSVFRFIWHDRSKQFSKLALVKTTALFKTGKETRRLFATLLNK